MKIRQNTAADVTEHLVEAIGKRFPLKETDVGEMSSFRARGMLFTVRAFRAAGLGHVSVMKASGFFGLMNMDTLIVTPDARDLPILSYDRIRAMGKDKLYAELYDTTIDGVVLSSLAGLEARYSEALVPFSPGVHWYDTIRLPESLYRIAKKGRSGYADALMEEYLAAYLDTPCKATEAGMLAVKREKNAAYVNGLLTNGGPSTDVFLSSFGAEKTKKIFFEILFGIE